MKQKYLLLAIIAIACLTRLFFLSDFPKGFSGDEVQQGYSAYSILKTGRDEWGQFLPITPRGFGDFKPPLQTYLMVPSIAIFGLNEMAVRIPAAVVGVLTVILIYFLTQQIFQNKKMSLWAALLLAINPWHIQVSRTAFEGGVGVLLFSAGLLFFLKGLKNIKPLIISAILWGLALYTYHSYRLFLLLFIAFLFLYLKKKINLKKVILPGLLFIFFLLPLAFNIKYTLIRSADVGIFSTQKINDFFKNKGASPVPPIVDKLLDNKYLYLSSVFYENYLSYYSPQFLFTGARSDGSYLNFPGHPLLYPIEILSFYLGLYLLIKRKEGGMLLGWLMLAAIPAALSTGAMSANRVVTLLPLLTIISAYGLANILINKKIVLAATVILMASFINFGYFYLVKLPKNPSESLRSEYKQLFEKILSMEAKYDSVVMSKVFTQPQIFLAFYSKKDPVTFQQASRDWLRYEKADKNYIDQLESWNLGKFYFEDLNWVVKDSKRVNALIISKSEDFPAEAPAVYEIKKGDKTLYKFVQINDQ